MQSKISFNCLSLGYYFSFPFFSSDRCLFRSGITSVASLRRAGRLSPFFKSAFRLDSSWRQATFFFVLLSFFSLLLDSPQIDALPLCLVQHLSLENRKTPALPKVLQIGTKDAMFCGSKNANEFLTALFFTEALISHLRSHFTWILNYRKRWTGTDAASC